MNKKRLLMLLPAIGMIASGCGGGDEENNNNQDPGKGDDSTVELDKFNEIVSSMKQNHNYTLSINSVVEGMEDEAANYHRYMINNKAWYHDDSTFDAEGVIYQKDQGYCMFIKTDSDVIPLNLFSDFDYETDPRVFVSTNPNIGISDLYDTIGENLFYGDYAQDTNDKTKFVTTDINNLAVACYFTQYAPYISMGMLQVENSMTAIVDVNASKITLSLNYHLVYFDTTEHNDLGNIKIVVENVGKTNDDVISSYINEPSFKFEAPTEWPEGMDKIFNERFNKVIPNFPSCLSYGAVCEEILYDGFYYAGVQDVNCGNIASTYGEQLVSEGYTKVNDNKYSKGITDPVTSLTSTYNVIFRYEEPSTIYPKGVFYILYRCEPAVSSFASITAFNKYIADTGRSSFVPSFPAEDTCTGITNFKDLSKPEYGFYTGTSWMHVKIADYEKAKQWLNKFVEEMNKFGFNDLQSGIWNSYNFADSNSGTCIAVQKINKSSYAGSIDIRFQIYTVDVPYIETYGATPTDIEISGYKQSFELDDRFSFGGTCTLKFDNGKSRELKSDEFTCSGYNMSNEGEQTVTVTYQVDASTSFTKTYNITVESTRSVSKIELGGEPALQFKKGGTFNHTGLMVKATYSDGSVDYVGGDCEYDVDLSSTGIKEVTVSYTYHGDTVTAKYNILVNESLSFPSLSFESTDNLDYYGFADGFYAEPTDEFNYNECRSFYVDVYPLEGYSIKSVSVKNDPNAKVVYDDEYYMYLVTPTIDLSASEIVVKVELEGDDVIKYNVTKANISNGSITLEGNSYSAGSVVNFSVSANSGYKVDSVSAGDAQVTNKGNGNYSFVMPAKDVQVSAVISEVTGAHQILTNAVGSGSITNVKIGDLAVFEANAGEVVLFDAKPSDSEVYRVKSVTIEKRGGGTVEWTKTAGHYKFTMPNDDVTLNAEFETIPSYTITQNKSHCGIIYNQGGVVSNTAKPGSVIVFKVTANSEYIIESVTVTMTETGETVSCVPDFTPGNYRFTMPEGEVTINANCVPVSLASISVGGAKTEFTVGDDFSTEGLVVTARMNDDSTKIVTPTSIDSSKVNMSVAGKYEVSVSYTEGGITKTASYEIQVLEEGQESEGFKGGHFYGNYCDLFFNEDKTGSLEYNGDVVSFTWSVSGNTLSLLADETYDESLMSFSGNRGIFYGAASTTATLKDDFTKVTISMGTGVFKGNKTLNIVQE